MGFAILINITNTVSNLTFGPQEVQKETVFGDKELIYEVRRLKEYQRYEFWVSGSTSVGEGSPSPKVSQSPISRGNKIDTIIKINIEV